MSGHSLGKATTPWMGQWDSTWIHPWDCPPALNTHRCTPGKSHGPSGDTNALSPLRMQGQGHPNLTRTTSARYKIPPNQPQDTSAALGHPKQHSGAGGRRNAGDSTSGKTFNLWGHPRTSHQNSRTCHQALGNTQVSNGPKLPFQHGEEEAAPHLPPGRHQLTLSQPRPLLGRTRKVSRRGQCHLRGSCSELEIFYLVAEVWQEAKRLLHFFHYKNDSAALEEKQLSLAIAQPDGANTLSSIQTA